MLVPFVIDADSLIPDQAWMPSTLRACHNQLLDLWNRFGLLIHDGESFDHSKLKQAVEGLSPQQRSLWLAMLKQSPPVTCANGWAESVEPAVAQELCSIASLALVDDTRAEVDFGLNEDQDEICLSPTDGQRVVVCRLQSARHASVVQEAVAISQRNIESGTGYRDIWNLRFRGLALASSPELQQVVIVDRYAMDQHLRCPQGYLSGLHRFLKLLDEDTGEKRYVTLCSAWTVKLRDKQIGDLKAEMDALMQRLTNSNVKRLTVYMAPNSAFGTNARDRYIRFGRYVWELGHGLDIFESPVARHLCQASFKSDAESHRQVEKELRQQAKTFHCDRR